MEHESVRAQGPSVKPVSNGRRLAGARPKMTVRIVSTGSRTSHVYSLTPPQLGEAGFRTAARYRANRTSSTGRPCGWRLEYSQSPAFESTRGKASVEALENVFGSLHLTVLRPEHNDPGGECRNGELQHLQLFLCCLKLFRCPCAGLGGTTRAFVCHLLDLLT